MSRVLLADDHGVVLQGLRSILATAPDVEVVGTCVDGREVVEFVRQERPDVVVMDLKMPRLNGIQTLAELRTLDLLPPTIVLAATASQAEISAAVQEGAWGVIMKDQAPAVILESIQAVLAGEPWVRDPAPRRAPGANGDDLLDALTDRELEVALRAAQGASNKAIARELGIARGTVKVHLHRAYRKLDVGNRVQLALCLKDVGFT